jgi:hypothetical protein
VIQRTVTKRNGVYNYDPVVADPFVSFLKVKMKPVPNLKYADRIPCDKHIVWD